jgi:hypothetical protein
MERVEVTMSPSPEETEHNSSPILTLGSAKAGLESATASAAMVTRIAFLTLASQICFAPLI